MHHRRVSCLRCGYEVLDVVIVYGRSCTFDVLQLFHILSRLACKDTQVQFSPHIITDFFGFDTIFLFIQHKERREQFTADRISPLAAKRLSSFFFPTARNKSDTLRIPSLSLSDRKGLSLFIFFLVLSLCDRLCTCLKLAHFLYNSRCEGSSLYPTYILVKVQNMAFSVALIRFCTDTTFTR
jgi:hypothetical protein